MTDYLALALEQIGKEQDGEARSLALTLHQFYIGPAIVRERPESAAAVSDREMEGELFREENRKAVSAQSGLEKAAGETDALSPALAFSLGQGDSTLLREESRRETGDGEKLAEAAAGTGLPLLTALLRAERGTEFARGHQRAFTITLPEGVSQAGHWSAEDLDRTVERDARRYDGGFSLY